MTPEGSQRPLVELPFAAGGGSGSAPPVRHELVLSAEPGDALHDLAMALELKDVSARRDALERVVAASPTLLEGWARLSELSHKRGEPVIAYAHARVAYHRGLDRLRREGWGGTGIVRWARPSNRGFLRGLHALLTAAATIGEVDEYARCREFLIELDPDDGLEVSAYPAVPAPGWTPPTPA